MLFGKKTAVSLSSMILLSVVGACSSNVTPMAVAVNGNTSFADSNLVTRISQNVTQSKQDPNHFYIDAGKGQVTGASLTVKLNLGNGGFATKASSSGAPAKVIGDIASFDVALIDSSTSPVAMPATPTAAGNITKTVTAGTAPVNGPLATTGSVGTGATTPTTGTGPGVATVITFTNLPQSTNAYWVAAAAKDSTLANITNASGTLTNAAGPGVLGQYYVSSTGGGATTGSMKVTKSVLSGKAQYAVENTSDLGIAMTLADTAAGANIGSVITINDGTTAAVSGPIVIQ